MPDPIHGTLDLTVTSEDVSRIAYIADRSESLTAPNGRASGAGAGERGPVPG